MKTFVLPLLIAFVFPFHITFSQTDGKYLMKFYDHHYSLAANKYGQLAIATKPGEVALASTENGIWRKTYLNKNINGPTDRVKIYNICYFNADTAFVSGVIYNNEQENRSEDIYHTVDGGKTWRRVKFGMEGPIDATVFLDNGEAWLSVGYRGIAYTKNYGLAWTRLNVTVDTADKNQRYSRIFFSKSAGIIGSRRNKLAFTNDNCKSWTIIPTPFSQGKHTRKNDENKEDSNAVPIEGVAIFKDYLLVQQENKVYYSNLHNIQWIPLPEYKYFYTDPENSALFFRQNNGRYVKCDSELKLVLSIDGIGHPYGAICKNGNLYVAGKDKLWQINTSNQLTETSLYSHVDEWKEEPVMFGSAYTDKSYWVGHIGNQIYMKADYNWTYAFTLPFETDGGSFNMKDNDVIMYSYGDSVFYYSISAGKLSKANGTKEIYEFCAEGIQKIVFINMFGSCFKTGEQDIIYTLQGNQYVLAGKNIEGSNSIFFIKDCPDRIDQRPVTEFVNKIPAIYAKQGRVDEMGLTREDYDSCKRSIIKFKSLYEAGRKEDFRMPWEIENPDFTKLIALVDSVKTISPELLNWYFLNQNYYGIVHHRYTIKLVNTRGKELEIQSDDHDFNGFYCPWQVKVNDLYSVNTADEIRRFIKDVFPDFLHKEDRVALIQGLVKQLYWQWESDE